MQHKFWLILRVLVITIYFVHGVSTPSPPTLNFDQGTSFRFIAEIFSISIMGSAIVLGTQGLRRISDSKWPRPSWFDKPLRRYFGFYIFELGAYTFLAEGFGSALVELWSQPRGFS